MVRFIEGVEHAAMGAETLERHRGLAENDEHHALAMEASQLLDGHLGNSLEAIVLGMGSWVYRDLSRIERVP